ncbi:MAG: hypothetical protein ACYC7D_10390 [Nitrososphaerales archaeon]
MNLRDLFLTRRYARFLLGILAVALALGWSKAINAGYVYFPSFDYFDVTIGLLIGVYLLYSWVAEPIQSNRNLQNKNAKTINQ